MAVFAIVNNGVVENTVVADSAEVCIEQHPGCEVIEFDQDGGIPISTGWLYNGTSFSNPI